MLNPLLNILKTLIFLNMKKSYQCLNKNQSILAINWLIYSSLFPQSPLLWKGCLLSENPPLGPLSLNGHMKLLASLKWGPTVWISLIKSSTLLIPCLPTDSATIIFDERGILCLLTLPYPLLRMSFLIDSLEGYPKVI